MTFNILLLSHAFYPSIGGIEICSELLALSFVKLGYSVRVVTWTENLDDSGFPFIIIRNPSIKTLLFEHSQADVILENNPCLRLSWPRLFYNTPSVVTLQTWLGAPSSLTNYIKSKWLSKSQFVVAISEAIRHGCWIKAVVIGNPYQNNIFRKKSDQHRSKDFVFLGRLVSDKGADLAIKAIYQLMKSELLNRKLSLTIIGDGPEQKPLEALVYALGLQEQVLFMGSLSGETLVKNLNHHRYILIPSRWKEPFGIVALEGLACGCLPIVADGGGLPEAIGKAGLVFERDNLNSLVNRLEMLLNNPGLEDSLREAAADHLKNYEIDTIAKRYLELMEQIVLHQK